MSSLGWMLNKWHLCQLLSLCGSKPSLLVLALSGTLQDTLVLYQLVLVGLCQWVDQREATRLEGGEGTCSSLLDCIY